MATIHVMYDPSDRLGILPPDDLRTQWPWSEIKFVTLKCDDPETDEQIEALARDLAKLLLKQL